VGDASRGPSRSEGSLSAADLEDLVRRYGDVVYRVAAAIVHDHSLAEDVVQEVIVKAWTALPQGDSSDAIRWLRVVARNTAIDVVRRRRFDDITAQPPEQWVSSPSTARIVEGRHHLDAMWTALGELDIESRTMLAMREAEQMSYDEIATTLGMTASAVKAKLFRARHLLRRNLTAWESDASF
jgi:RNA polymerase sigma-70 factor (ECF subfamily)